jgi:hypothetical protein
MVSFSKLYVSTITLNASSYYHMRKVCYVLNRVINDVYCESAIAFPLCL